ncbi:carboxymuconolactone decarboxylase family protein [Paraburkholderia phytofirmans]|uniref:carboxymuconolactone decarboxylase family protein n=1 Tax=Paraburkholderia phytofirmans TaxID=261302 RepID=UPI0038B98FC3
MSSSATQVFPALHDDQIPTGSLPFLEKVKKVFGFVPNLFAVFSNFPVLLEGYLALDAIYSKGTLSPAERQLVLLTASVVNECTYCTAAHSTVAKGMLKVPAAVVAAVRAQQPLADAKLNALVNLTRELVLARGHVATATIQSFLNAGYRNDQIGEVLIGVALKTMSNYTHHLSPVEIDSAFKAEA